MITSLFCRLGAFFIGLIAGYFHLLTLPAKLLAVFSLICAWLLRRQHRWQNTLIVIACLNLGLWRAQDLKPLNQKIQPYFGQTETWDFWVCTDPEPDWQGQTTIVCPAEPFFNREAEKEKIIVKLPLYPRVNYGDYLQLRCRLEKPPVFAEFDYASYLAARGIGATCSWPKIINVEKDKMGNRVMRRLYGWKRDILHAMNRSLPEPASGLASALLLGYKKTLAPIEESNFKKAGLSHIVAISGGHITLFLDLIISLAIYLGMNRRRAIWPALAAAALYVVLTGIQASAWRSLLMGGIMLYAWQRGRLQTAWLPLALAAAFMLYLNPLLWRYDLGFQLSFLAIGGMIAFNPLLASRRRPSDSVWYRLKQTLIAAFKLSLSAQVAVWPLLALTSGGISLISPFTNVLAFWVFGPLVLALLAALAIGLGLGISGIIWIPSYLLLEYLLWVGRIGANFPGGYIEVPWFKTWQAVIYYLFLILYIIWKQKKIDKYKKFN